MDYAFAAGNDTGAVLIIKNGYLVAERYSPTRNRNSLVTSWSVAKSITSALVGAAFDDNYLTSVDQSMAEFIPAWANTDKASITIDHLLTVRTALRLIQDDNNDGIPDGSDFYLGANQLALSIDRVLDGTPGDQLYTYSNSDVMLAGEVVHVATQKQADEYLHERIGETIGFDGEWWTDAADNVLTYCCLDATARDFARFGWLFASEGNWNGQQLLSETWINQSTSPALSGTYGYYWWPFGAGAYAALGVQGQMIVIYPELDLVILRFGNYTRTGDGSTVRADGNFHTTTEPMNFDLGVFVTEVLEDLGIEDSPLQNPANNMPMADAGRDQSVMLFSTVTLFGGNSADSDNDSLLFDWQVTARPTDGHSAIIGSGDAVNFTADVLGTYEFLLTVTDEFGAESTDTVSINVTNTRSLLTDGTSTGMWPNYAGNLSSNKYSPLSQINRDNLNELEIAWRWRSPDNDLTSFQNSVFEPTPLMIDGVLYTSTSFSQVAAIDAETGQSIWIYDPQSYQYGRPPNNGFLHRGVSYDEANGRKTIYMPTGDARLIALDAISGKPLQSFGSSGTGTVDLLDDVPRLDPDAMILNSVHDQPDVPDLAGVVAQIGNTSPGVICNDVLIVGSSIHDGEVLPPSPPGDVRGFDLVTGELKWTFHTVPREGEFGIDTWDDDSWQTNGNTNVWAPMSADEELGQVYLPVSCPTNNYYGGRRPGDNLFANSIVALNCETGERTWHFQTVHHDIWDYDLPAAPNLIDITVSGQSIKALAQVSKQGFVYVLDRETGEPVWPIVETAVPASTVPGEITSPTQPIPTKPPPFVKQGSSLDNLINSASAAGLDVGPLFTPPTTNGLIITPGEGGGANWGGASFDPTTQRLYVAGFGPLTHKVTMTFGNLANFYYGRPELFFGPSTGSPYPGLGSAITAYDMNEGEILWQVAGDTNQSVIGNSATMIAGDLLYYKNSSLGTLNVFDKSNGALLRRIALGGRPTGSPMTYSLNGRQYIVIALGRQDELMELVALSLPE
jgi:quinoprotein glucose dehydrogenase